MLTVSVPSFKYSEKEVLKDISFQLNPGEHLCILGESGCGKSTLLHLIYGLLPLSKASISWKEKKLLGPNHRLIPGEPFIKLVAQDLDLMPFATVAETVSTHLSPHLQQEAASRVDQLLQVVGMQAYHKTQVNHLSGGQKQRVALAKALAHTPEILLLDEPFSHIDTFRKNTLRRTLFTFLKENNITCITATHDSEEALAFADKILMLKEATIELWGTAEEVYQQVATRYQAGFFGEVNILPSSWFFPEETMGELLLFPHQLQLAATVTPLSVKVKKNYFKGSFYLIQCFYKETEVFFEHSEKLKEETPVYLQLSANQKK